MAQRYSQRRTNVDSVDPVPDSAHPIMVAPPRAIVRGPDGQATWEARCPRCDDFPEHRMTWRVDAPISPSSALPRVSPLDVPELAVQVTALTLPAPGVYRWQVLCAGEVIHERKFPAAQLSG